MKGMKHSMKNFKQDYQQFFQTIQPDQPLVNKVKDFQLEPSKPKEVDAFKNVALVMASVFVVIFVIINGPKLIEPTSEQPTGQELFPSEAFPQNFAGLTEIKVHLSELFAHQAPMSNTKLGDVRPFYVEAVFDSGYLLSYPKGQSLVHSDLYSDPFQLNKEQQAVFYGGNEELWMLIAQPEQLNELKQAVQAFRQPPITLSLTDLQDRMMVSQQEIADALSPEWQLIVETEEGRVYKLRDWVDISRLPVEEDIPFNSNQWMRMTNQRLIFVGPTKNWDALKEHLQEVP